MWRRQSANTAASATSAGTQPPPIAFASQPFPLFTLHAQIPSIQLEWKRVK